MTILGLSEKRRLSQIGNLRRGKEMCVDCESFGDVGGDHMMAALFRAAKQIQEC